jgi:hypothetical protein
MDSLPPPLAFVVLLFAGWVNRQQQAVIDYLLEENRVLRTAHGARRLRLTDDQRRRLAVKGKVLGRRRLAGIVGIVTPDTILRWYQEAIAGGGWVSSDLRQPGLVGLTRDPGNRHVAGLQRHDEEDDVANEAAQRDSGVTPLVLPAWSRNFECVCRTVCATTAQRGDCEVTAVTSLQLCCTRDEGRPLGLGLQDQGPNCRPRRRHNGRGRERDGKGRMYLSGVCWKDERE